MSFGCHPLSLLTNLCLAGIPLFHSIWLLTSLPDLDFNFVEFWLLFCLIQLLAFVGSHHHSCWIYLWVFVGFLVPFGFVWFYWVYLHLLCRFLCSSWVCPSYCVSACCFMHHCLHYSCHTLREPTARALFAVSL